VQASSALATAVSPTGMYPARHPAASPQYGPGPDVVMAPSLIGTAGGSQPHTNMQPGLGLQFCIALQGVFPSNQ
jgi:microcystin-dependent protein